MYIMDPGPSEEELLEQATKMFGGKRHIAEEWFDRPNLGLGDVSPREMTKTPAGSIKVEELIGRLSRGETI